MQINQTLCILPRAADGSFRAPCERLLAWAFPSLTGQNADWRGAVKRGDLRVLSEVAQARGPNATAAQQHARSGMAEAGADEEMEVDEEITANADGSCTHKRQQTVVGADGQSVTHQQLSVTMTAEALDDKLLHVGTTIMTSIYQNVLPELVASEKRAKEYTDEQLYEAEKKRQQEREADKQALAAEIKRVAHSEAQSAAEENDQRMDDVEDNVNGVLSEVDVLKAQLENVNAQFARMEKDMHDLKRQKMANGQSKPKGSKKESSNGGGKAAQAGQKVPRLPSSLVAHVGQVGKKVPHDLLKFDTAKAVLNMHPPPLYVKNFKRHVVYTGNDDHIMTRKQLLDTLLNEPDLMEFDFTGKFREECQKIGVNVKTVKYHVLRNLHTFMRLVYPDSKIEFGYMHLDTAPRGCNHWQWYYCGVRYVGTGEA